MIGFGLGLLALATSAVLARRSRPVDDGWVTAGAGAVAVGVLILDHQLDAASLAVVAVAAAGGGALGRWRRVRAWAPDADVAALVALVVVFATLPDTEGPSLLGAALVPITIGALIRRTWWRGAPAGAALATLAGAVATVTVDGAAGRTGALVVAAVGAAVCALLVVVAVRLLVERTDPFTSERGRPSR